MTDATHKTDLLYMDLALAWARSQLGHTAPNPSVGCVLVKAGKVLACGATRPGGRPHAERVALARAGEAARGATAYVTLEPCNHHGVTSPCSEALLEAGIVRVVIGCRDPHAGTNGAGIARLQAGGVEIVEQVRTADAIASNAGFFHRLQTGHPLVGQAGRMRAPEAVLPLDDQRPAEVILEHFGELGINRLAVPHDHSRLDALLKLQRP
ncbi:bifunctional diaminohydroxyphosphoribosylaminopyrimidine deaminase/5-amino-6-(5-phosphoribosylamino)uracil reductase RibD [Maricaulis sp. D1M11]|uniref:bifunctional diaminohydroxyphosphoribosylaminopyrimidine deaminase/5-amino-6-(5-phosphoribosylamino)uracil reductase RibD n=1 Tax=Maricaulis sp. D1M11 TaxID=3076117 RepID=UPI0039B5BAB2